MRYFVICTMYGEIVDYGEIDAYDADEAMCNFLDGSDIVYSGDYDDENGDFDWDNLTRYVWEVSDDEVLPKTDSEAQAWLDNNVDDDTLVESNYSSSIANGIVAGAARQNTDLVDTTDYRGYKSEQVRPYWKKPTQDLEYDRSIKYLTPAEYRDALNRFKKTGKLDLYEVDIIIINKIIRELQKEYGEGKVVAEVDRRGSNASIKLKSVADAEKAEREARIARAPKQSQDDSLISAITPRLAEYKEWIAAKAKEHIPVTGTIEQLTKSNLVDLIDFKIEKASADWPFPRLRLITKSGTDLGSVGRPLTKAFLKDKNSQVADKLSITYLRELIARLYNDEYYRRHNQNFTDALIKDYE